MERRDVIERRERRVVRRVWRAVRRDGVGRRVSAESALTKEGRRRGAEKR